MGRYDFVAVYILASQRNGTLYTGVTSDLLQRVSMHCEGRVPGFTRDYDCKTLVWYEQHSFMAHAIKRENQVKRWCRAWKLKLIEDVNPQ